MPNKTFPAVDGGCVCGEVRYRMTTAPLICHACHCSECQKATGSAFAPFCVIEADRVHLIGKTSPITITIPTKPNEKKSVACPKCYTFVWDHSDEMAGVISIKTGTLDIPSLMEPDIHIFIQGKVAWLPLSQNAKVFKGYYDRHKEWPKCSLARLEACVAKHAADRTPRAESPAETDEDEEVEKKFDEIERGLRERLEKLTLKLNEQEKV